MYYSNKNSLPGIYDDNDIIFNGINDKINQDDIQNEELKLSAALSTASKTIITSDNLQETDVLSNCKVQLKTLQKKYLYNNNYDMNFKISFYFYFILYLYLYLYLLY